MTRQRILKLPDDERPVYLRIAEGVRRMIDEGLVRPGEALPSSRELARRVGVHRHTIMAAFQELVAEGWLVPHERAAYVVNEHLPVKLSAPLRRSPACGRLFPWKVVARAKMPDLPADEDEFAGKIAFSSGKPDLRLFPADEFRLRMKSALRKDTLRILDYGDPAGYPPFVAALKDYLRQRRAIADREIVVTNGSIEAFLLIAQLLLGPGKCVAVEALCYQPMYALFKNTGAHIVPVDVDAQGLVPEALEKVLARQHVDLLYLTPLHQYPTTVTLPLPRRRRIYELARRHRVPIVEDDYDHEFHYRSQPLAPLAADDPDDLVLYVSTFSKSLFPGSRIGYIAVPPVLYPTLRALHKISTGQNEGIVQAAFAEWMADDGFERHLRRMRRTYDERLRHLLSAVDNLREQELPVGGPRPDGGMALWLDTGRDAAAVARRARELGVLVNPETIYRADGRKHGTHVRLGFACLNQKEIDMGVELLSKAIGKVPISYD